MKSNSTDQRIINGQLADCAPDRLGLLVRNIDELEAILEPLVIADFSMDRHWPMGFGQLKLQLHDFTEIDVTGHRRPHAAFIYVPGTAVQYTGRLDGQA